MAERLADYMATGDGPVTVFLLHGGYGAKEYWRPEIAALAQAGYRVIAWDAPGYGLSPLPEGTYSIERLADAAAQLIRARGSKCNVVFGHSMGGLIAPKLAAAYPDLVQGMVLSATMASLAQGGANFKDDFMKKRLDPINMGATLADAAIPLVRSMMAPGSSGPLVDLIVETAAGTPSATFRAALQAIASYDGTPVLAQVKAPTLCIAGEHDPVGSPANMQKLADMIKDAEFAAIAGAGHYAWAEKPDAFNKALFDFLKRRVA
ncbi:alpha/beta fold hydrolase [Ferrovibrio sp.]|uniref:alpha/beta fold hydrolase n=1 Tax=Ferrovibrio sp. TaxID=1917215 RepID=UPI0025C5085C|nr:alpha/beta fold hydrolase [Ferrovibrio sp.]MBX3453724.1 alpha/beta fold hydrolase [Ferrovibrio sp.]